MRAILLLSALVFFSCSDIKQETTEQYFDVPGLLSEQYLLLNEKNISLSKSAVIGVDSSKVTITPDTTIWKNELGIFQRIDINRPQWRDGYEVSEQDDKYSNLTIRKYVALEPSAEVKELKIYFLKEISEVRKIEAQWEENNPIYKSQRDLTMFFEDINDDIILNRYEIKGSQKMMLQEKVSFEISVKIDLLNS